MRRHVVLFALLLVATPAAAEQEPKTVKQSRLYLKLLLESKAPPFASARQPLHVEIDDDDGDCKGLQKAKVTTDAQSKQLKACAMALRSRFSTPVDKIYMEPVTVDAFAKRFPKKLQQRVRTAAKGMSLVDAGIAGDGESMTIVLGLNKEFSIRAIWIQTDAAE